jgi:hypothetical protein
VELNSAAPDAIQSEFDGCPYHWSIRARNALLLHTELRSGSAMVGFLKITKVDTLIRGTIDLATDSEALARVSNTVFFAAIRTAWANYQSLSSTMSWGPAPTGVVFIRDPDVAKFKEERFLCEIWAEELSRQLVAQRGGGGHAERTAASHSSARGSIVAAQ